MFVQLKAEYNVFNPMYSLKPLQAAHNPNMSFTLKPESNFTQQLKNTGQRSINNGWEHQTLITCKCLYSGLCFRAHQFHHNNLQNRTTA